LQASKSLAVASAVYLKSYGTKRIRGHRIYKETKGLFERSYYHISIVGLSCFLLPYIISMIFLIPCKTILNKNQSTINIITGWIFFERE